MLKKIRERKNLTQDDVARAAGIPLATYRAIERGISKHPRYDTISKIARALGVSTKTLMGEK